MLLTYFTIIKHFIVSIQQINALTENKQCHVTAESELLMLRVRS